MREDHQKFDRSDDGNLESSVDNCVSKVVNSAIVKISEPNSSMSVDLKSLKTWNRSFVYSSASVHTEAEGISTRLKSRKYNLEKRSSRGPIKSVQMQKRKFRDLGHENTSALVPVKEDCISTRLHDEPGTYISKIKSSGKQQFQGTRDLGPSRAANSTQIKSNVLTFSNSSGSVPDKVEHISPRLREAKFFKFEPSRKRRFEEMSDLGSNPVNPKNREPHDLSFGNSGASGPVKVEHVSARLHDGSDTHIFKTDPSRKSRFEQISESGPGRTENPKQGGISDSSPSKAVNSEQMIKGEAKGISTQLHAKSGTSIPKVELSSLANPVLPRADWCQLLTSYGAESYFSSLYCYYGLKYNLDQDPLVTAIEADNFELVKLLLFKEANPRELVNKVKEKVRKIQIIMEQRQAQNDPGYPSLIAHWLKKQIEFNIKCKSNTLLPLV
ncbi:hypothetical protein QYM36_016754, partial [Artemia franciscana]